MEPLGKQLRADARLSPTDGSGAPAESPLGLLAGVRVIDLAKGADAFCGKLLADLGADVVRVDQPTRCDNTFDLEVASPEHPERDSFSRHYDTNKRSIAIDSARLEKRTTIAGLLADADAVIASGTPSELAALALDPESLRAAYPHLIVAVISPFGTHGPRSNWKSCDLVAQAMGGMVYVNGHPGQPPLRAWGPQSHHAASLHAAIGILLALLVRQRIGSGQLVDISLQESVTSMLEHVGATFHANGEIQERRGTLHWTRTFRVGQCRDGYVLLSILGDWTSLIEWMKADGAGKDFLDPAWEDVEHRREHCEPLFAELNRWAQRYSLNELVEGAQARRLPFAPLLGVDDLPRQEQLIARKFFVSLQGRVYPGAPYRFSMTQEATESSSANFPESSAGEFIPRRHTRNNVPKKVDSLLARRGSPEADEQSPPARPLEAIRILDFTWVVAGPLATRVLADHGADVIKIERLDAKGLDRRREALTASLNRGKRSVILNMADVRGIEIARELVRHCDVVIDNFSSRVMKNWGLSDTELRQINPEIITLGMSGFGRTGPLRDYVSYGPTLQAMAGFTWHMRRPGGEPTGWGFSYSDMVSGYSAAYAILAALWLRSRTGEGQSIDLAQYEALLSFIGPELTMAANGVPVPVPSTLHGAPEGIYRCRDLESHGTMRDRWCAIAVFSDAEWKRCIRALGDEAWAQDPRFASFAGRRRHREELDALLESWTSQRRAEDIMHDLQAANVAAGVVADAEDLCLRDPHLAERRYWQSMETPDGRLLALDAVTPRLSSTPGRAASLAPQPGDNTDQVLREILRMEQTAIDALRRDHIIA